MSLSLDGVEIRVTGERGVGMGRGGEGGWPGGCVEGPRKLQEDYGDEEYVPTIHV